MRFEQKKEVIENIVIMYYSDDGKFSSKDKYEVEVYEARKNCTLNKITDFTLPDSSNNYTVYKVNSRADFIALIDAYKEVYLKVKCFGFYEDDIPADINDYFITYYVDSGDPLPYITVYKFSNFLADLKKDTAELRAEVELKEKVVASLENLKDE